MNSFMPPRLKSLAWTSRLASGVALLGAAALGAGFLEVATSVPAGAVTNVAYVVNTNANAPGTCPATTGHPCTLQTAVADYDALPSGDAATITFSGGGTASTVAYVQNSDNTSATNSGTQNTGIFSSTPSVGDTVVLFIQIGANASTVSNITGLGATWTQQGSVVFNSFTDLLFSGIVGASPNNNLTVTDSTTTPWYVAGDEFSGVASVSGYKSGTADNTAPQLTLDPSVGQAADVWGNTFSAGATVTPGSPWTDHDGGFSANNVFGAEEVAAAAGNVTATWTTPSNFWATNGVLLSPSTASTYSIAGTGLTFDNPNGVPLTMTGSGAATTVIDGGGTASNLDSTTPASVTITGVTVQNVADDDGAVEAASTGNLTLTSDTLTHNTLGGAIDAFPGGTVSGSSLTVTSNSAIGLGGGGIYDSGLVLLSGSSVTNNTTATGSGGGILVTSTGVLSLSNDSISGNTTTPNGTTAASFGGGVASLGGKVTASNTTISGNTATGSVANEGLGGGLYVSSSGTTNLNLDTISGNTATGTGAGDGLGGGLYISANTTFANEVTVSANKAAGDTTTGGGGIGGGIYKSGATSFSFGNGSVVGNSATGTGAEGGGVALLGGPMITVNDSISTNNATGSGAFGGGLYLNGTSAGMNLVTISSDSASGTNASGGGVYIASGSNTINDALITLNTASQNGGGVDLSAGTLVLNSSTISHNTATSGDGGGIYQSGGTLSLNSDTITGNKAVAGGGLYKTGGTTFQSPNVKITGNTPAP